MAETVLSFALDQLAILVREESRLLGGLRQEVQLITKELQQMKAFLKVAEAKEDDEPRLKEWINQVREAAYDAEDILDDFVARFAPLQRSRGLYGSIRKIFNSIKTLRARHRVARDIQRIKTEIECISDAHQRYQFEYGSSSGSVSESPTPVDKKTWRYSRDDALLVDEAKLVGIEQPKQQLISQLLEYDDSHFKVISVVGMGGLGKTTLVKRVYEDIDVKRQFPFRAWITVSQTFDFRELLRNLIRLLHAEIKKTVPQSIVSMGDPELKGFVKDFLQGGRYLIVFDDVWDTEFWNAIKFVLPENNSHEGNRVMLTTRMMDVASSASHSKGFHGGHIHSGYIHKMKPLSYEESWILFCNRIFEDGCCPDHLKDAAQVVLGKCEGLPLAVLAISGMLGSKDVWRIDEWKRVQLSLGGELEGSGKLDRVNKILCLSYNDLPSHLKTCLLYLSIYPEDCKIPSVLLIDQWIAERFVAGNRMNIRDVAWDYLKQLADRSLIEVTSELHDGSNSDCRIHDLLREVILSKSQEQNMVTVVSTEHDEYTRWPEKVRRLVIYNDNFLTSSRRETNCYDHLRSLIIYDSIQPTTLSSVLSASKLLKVLDLSNTNFEEIPNQMFNLFHLKFLNLHGTRVKRIPKSIGKLKNLEYLALGETEVTELPMEILQLRKLYLLLAYKEKVSGGYVEYDGFRAPAEIGRLLSLQTLDAIDVGAAAESDETSETIIKEIGKLTALRRLGITNLKREDGKLLCSSLENLPHLQHLDVISLGEVEIIDLNHFHSSSSSPPLQSLSQLQLKGRLEKIPQCITYLQGLVSIILVKSRLLKEDFLDSLQHLPNLARVQLIQAYRGERLHFRAGGFLKLKELCLSDMRRLRWMTIDDGAMPSLKELIVQELPLLKELPVGIEHLKQFRRLELRNMSSELTNKLKEHNEGTDVYQKIAHIPEVEISIWTDDEEWSTRRLWKKMESNI